VQVGSFPGADAGNLIVISAQSRLEAFYCRMDCVSLFGFADTPPESATTFRRLQSSLVS
jgi:hypothetical protein